MSCFSFYQVQGAYARLNQRQEKDLDEAVAAATTLIYYNDLLRLTFPYVYLLEMLPEPPDGLLKSILSLTLILIVYLYPILRGLTCLWRISLIAYMSQRKLPTLQIRMYATYADPNDKAFSWDTDGIPFVADNSATAIIRNECRRFHGNLIPTRVMPETAEGVSTKTQLVGICRLVLTNNKNINYTYDVPGCVFDPSKPINILGVPAPGTFFGDNSNAGSPYEEDGTTIKSVAMRSHFIWDHGKHKRHFMHGSSLMPEIHLYFGHGYFNAFCTRIHKLLREKVHYAFSSAYLIDPSAATTEPHDILAEPGDIEGENNIYQWYCPAAEDTSEPIRKVTWN